MKSAEQIIDAKRFMYDCKTGKNVHNLTIHDVWGLLGQNWESNFRVYIPDSDYDDSDDVIHTSGSSLAMIERGAIIKALENNNFVQNAAAHELDITPRVMNYKIQQYGITHPGWKRNV